MLADWTIGGTTSNEGQTRRPSQSAPWIETTLLCDLDDIAIDIEATVQRI